LKDIVYYHNPRCAKSREGLKLLRENGVEPRVVEYLKLPLSPAELRSVLAKLNLSPLDIIRKKETLYREKLSQLTLNEEEWTQVLADNPILMERPIGVKGNKAVVGRPPEELLKLI
jgi:arsenate reductase